MRILHSGRCYCFLQDRFSFLVHSLRKYVQIVEKCDTRLGETQAEELAEAVTENLPPPPSQSENQDVQESEALAEGDLQGIDEPGEPEAEAGISGILDDGDGQAEGENLMDVS